MTYRLLEHPADVGIEASGASLEEALGEAVAGLAEVIAGGAEVRLVDGVPVEVEGDGPEEQLVALLEEVLYLLDARAWLAGAATVEALGDHGLIALLRGEDLDEIRHGDGVHVKAITWHQLSITTGDAGCVLRVFVDI